MDLSGVSRQVVVPVRTDPEGRRGPTPDQARGRGWQRTGRGYYVPTHVDSSGVDQRVVEAAVALPDDWGAVTGWAALGWAGGTWFDGSPWGGGRVRPVTLAIGGHHAIRRQPSFALSEERLSPDDLVVVDGLRLTSLPRSVCFEMRYAANVRHAAVFLSMAAYDDLVSIDEATAYAATLPGWTGIPQCRRALGLAAENSWSPQEDFMRMIWVLDAGLGWPLCNVPVFGPDGRLLGVPDLLDPVAGVVGEYDGSLHLEGERRGKDLQREHRFRSHGLEYVTMLAGDSRDSTAFISRLAAAYERAADIPEARKLWTLERPPWWTDTSTVAARRALSADQRLRLLPHRAA